LIKREDSKEPVRKGTLGTFVGVKGRGKTFEKKKSGKKRKKIGERPNPSPQRSGNPELRSYERGGGKQTSWED